MYSIEQLPKLRMFSTNNLFGIVGEQFPGPGKMPNLSWLWLTSLPADTAQSIKAAYKKETAQLYTKMLAGISSLEAQLKVQALEVNLLMGALVTEYTESCLRILTLCGIINF